MNIVDKLHYAAECLAGIHCKSKVYLTVHEGLFWKLITNYQIINMDMHSAVKNVFVCIRATKITSLY